MADSNARNRVPAAPARPAPATPLMIEEEEDAPFDPASFDPAEFEWRPVPRRPRADGWTPEVQRAFIQALADTGMVEHAARAVDMSVQSAYRLRRAPGGEAFARAWTVALADAAERMLDIAFARAIEGDETPVFDRDGRRMGARRKISDRMMMFLLRAYLPERFAPERVAAPRGAPAPAQSPAQSPVSSLPPLDQALAALTPPTPANPHHLLPPDELEALVDHARAMAIVDEIAPPDEREHYVPPRIEPDDELATERAAIRQLRKSLRPDPAADLYYQRRDALHRSESDDPLQPPWG